MGVGQIEAEHLHKDKNTRLFIKLCHWFPKVPFFQKDNKNNDFSDANFLFDSSDNFLKMEPAGSILEIFI